MNVQYVYNNRGEKTNEFISFANIISPTNEIADMAVSIRRKAKINSLTQ